MNEADIEAAFPALVGSGWTLTSLPTPKYNCIGWAAGDATRWWWPTIPGYWPAPVPRSIDLSSFVGAYQALSYVQCDNGDLEEGFEKVVIYIKDGTPTHAARQLEDGMWTSKLGPQDDVSHPLEGLDGTLYGTATIFLRRVR